jgi:MYXO-CTERM domain-containing protein
VVVVTSLPSSAVVPIVVPPSSGVASTGVPHVQVLIAAAWALGVLGLALVWFVRRRHHKI